MVAAAAIGLIKSIAQAAGFVGPLIVGFLNHQTHSIHRPGVLPLASLPLSFLKLFRRSIENGLVCRAGLASSLILLRKKRIDCSSGAAGKSTTYSYIGWFN